MDINLLLETLKSSTTRIGEWVNVIGYITKQECKQGNDTTKALYDTSLQAIVYWSAGALNLDEYEKTVAESQDTALTM